MWGTRHDEFRGCRKEGEKKKPVLLRMSRMLWVDPVPEYRIGRVDE